MKISTEIGSGAGRIGEEKAIALIAEAGFDAWDFSMFAMAPMDWEKNCMISNGHPLQGPDHLAYARKLRRIGESCGIHCNQSHAPFPIYVKEILDMQKRAIECTAEADGKICIIHPDNFKSAEVNAETYQTLLPFAEECGVKIATENMWCWNGEHATPAACSSPADFCRHIDIVGNPFFVACLDIGHAEMKGVDTSAVEMIRALGSSRLQALHVHDNDKWHDSHQLPFSMQIDFPPVMQALKEIGYTGYLTLEADQYLKTYEDGDLGKGYKAMAEAAKKLSAMFENGK